LIKDESSMPEPGREGGPGIGVDPRTSRLARVLSRVMRQTMTAA